MLWVKRARTTFVEIDAKLMRSGITLRSPSETEQQSSDSVATSDEEVDELSLSTKLSSAPCSEQTARQATKSHSRHAGNVTAKPRLTNSGITDSIFDYQSLRQLAVILDLNGSHVTHRDAMADCSQLT